MKKLKQLYSVWSIHNVLFENAISAWNYYLKWKESWPDANFVIIGGTAGCFDNQMCHQW